MFIFYFLKYLYSKEPAVLIKGHGTNRRSMFSKLSKLDISHDVNQSSLKSLFTIVSHK